MSNDLVSFVAVTSLVMLVPGPSVLFAVTHRLQGGPKAGLWAVLGLESGLSIHVVAACAGISGLVAASPTTLGVLQVVGGAYLAVLGLQLLLPAAAGRSHGPRARRGLGGIYRAGLMVDLLNPKTVIYFVALLPQFVDPSGGSVAHQSVLLGLCVVGLALLCDGGYTILAGRLQRRLVLADARAGARAEAGVEAGVEAGAGVRRPSSQQLAAWGQRASGVCFLGLAAVAVLS